MPKQLPRLENCLNCGQKVTDNFCSRCGQENENQTVSLRLLASDLLAELLSFDSKLVRTLVPLLIRPGFLTNEYNAGRRIRYLSPIKMYLVTSVIFFLIAASRSVPNAPTMMQRASAESAAYPSKAVRVSPLGVQINPSRLPATEEEYLRQQNDPKNLHKDSKVERFFTRQAIKLKQNPQVVVERMFDDAPKMMFLLLPIFALLLKLVYLRSRRLYVEHLIFALHSHAFLFLALSLSSLVSYPVVKTPVALSLPIYLIAAMRVVYRQPLWKTLLKFLMLGFCYLAILSLCLVALFSIIFLQM